MPYRGLVRVDLPAPSTLAEFVRYCHLNGDLVIARPTAFSSPRCEDLTDDFILKYLQGRREIALRELLPFIRVNHDYWMDVIVAIKRRLVLAEIICESTPHLGYTRPSRCREVILCAGEDD
jgi:hypothetical protein